MSPIPTTTISSTGIKVGQVGFGLMGFTWTDKPTPYEDAFKVMEQAIKSGSTFWNGGAFYGPQSDPHANLKLIKAFFDKFPEYKSQVTLSIKGGSDIEEIKAKGRLGMAPNASLEALRTDLKRARETLGSDNGGKEIDLFEISRRDTRVSVEDSIKNLVQLQKEKLFTHISLSEVGEETIRKAAATAGPGKIAAVEIEYSPWELTAESNGVLKACNELGITVIAYSPIGRGWLGGGIKSRSDLSEGDIRFHQDRFSEENFPKNLKLVEKYESEAKKKGITAAQLTLAWLIAQSPKGAIIPIPGTTNVGRVKENAEAANIKLSEEELKSFRTLIDSTQGDIGGERYSAMMRQHQALWG